MLQESQLSRPAPAEKPVIAIVFGSDQGLVGQFNDVLADYVAKSLRCPARREEGLGRR